ncbi:MAG: hypothetical protein U5K00_22640 [Melioribacteraceae bacterium]|nr:hypothetical protein [Melioribacteraceae bacterium]
MAERTELLYKQGNGVTLYDFNLIEDVNSIEGNPVYNVYREKVNVKSNAESIEYAELLPKNKSRLRTSKSTGCIGIPFL